MSTAGQAPAGSIETLSFARLLARFWERGFTGSFRARSEIRPGTFITKEILLERGKIAWAASDSPDEGIRAFLLSRGLLGADQWRLAEEKAAGSQTPAGAQTRQVLLDLGFLSPRELKNADRERVTSIVLGMFAWKDGEYAVAPGPLPPGTPQLKIDPRDLVLEGFMASGDREKVLHEIGSLETVFVVRPDDLARSSLSLPIEMADLMGKADGTRSVAEICSLSPLPDFLISATMAALKILGLAQPLEGQPGVAPPEPPRPAPTSGRTRPRRRSDAAAGAEPRLPYETPEIAAAEVGHEEVAAGREAASAETVQMEAPEMADLSTLPLETASVQDDSPETRPITQTPPDGVTSVTAGDGDEEAPGNERRADGAVKRTTDSGKVVWVSELMEEDERADPLWNVVTPPKVRAATPLSDEERNRITAPEDEVEEEAEVEEPELKAGIPVDPLPSPIRPDTATDADADYGEIEEAIDLLGTESGGTRDDHAPGEERAYGFDSQDREDAGTMDGSDRESFDEEPIEALDEAPEDTDGEAWAEGVERGPEGEGDPTWVYVPAGMEGPEPAARDRLIRWSGVAVAMLGLLVVVAVMMSGRTDAVHRDPGDDLLTASGPPAIDTPSSSVDAEPEDAEPEPGGNATEEVASNTPEIVPEPAGAAAPAPPPPAPAPKPQTPRIAAAGADSDLASPGAGDIFQSTPFRQGRSLLEQGKLRDAASRFAAAWSGTRGLYTLQLALACEQSTVTRAMGSSGNATEFFILPKAYRGRSCYRLLWGGFPDRDSALRAVGNVPRAFREGKSQPFPAPL